jgi:hypothetical protein
MYEVVTTEKLRFIPDPVEHRRQRVSYELDAAICIYNNIHNRSWRTKILTIMCRKAITRGAIGVIIAYIDLYLS